MSDSSEARLRATLNVIPAHTWYATPSGALTFVNKRTADYMGLPTNHHLRLGIDIGAAWDWHLALLHPDDHDETRKVWSNCLETGSAGELNFRVRDAHGAYRWRLSRVEPLRGDDGKLLYWIGINFDVDDRRRAEEALRRSEHFLAEAQRLSHVGSVGMEVSAGRMFWSEESARIYGYAPGTEPTPELILQRVHPEDVGRVKDALDRAAKGKHDFDYEHRLAMPDGSIKHIYNLCHCRKDAAGNAEIAGAIMDITERRVAEAQLRQVLDLTPQLVSVNEGPGQKRLYANRGLLDYLGTTLDEWRQRSAGSDAHPDDLKRLSAYIERSKSAGFPFEMETRIRKVDGSYRWFLTRFNPMRDDKGNIRRWYVANTDIDDRKRTEERLQEENVALREEIDKTSMFEEIVGSSPALMATLSRVSKVAGSDSTVLITGETGTGKELIARAIHRRSGRSANAFVAVNCAAIPRDLIASELFGHERGAFTGAVQRRVGRFELANSGTIFLDEVAELSPEMQATLLRVLQEREIEHVGGTKSIPVDVRVIAATNRNLTEAVAGGSFREDLFYRLNVFPLEMPPLRDRKQDISVLVEYFIHRYAAKAHKTFRSVSKKTLSRLQSYPWPGNVRELQNVIERSVIVCDTEEFEVDGSWLTPVHKLDGAGALASRLSAYEKALIEEALLASGGQVFGPTGAAARLRLPRTTLESRIRALRINKSRFRPRPD